MISEIRMVTISVKNLDNSVRFYRDGFQFVELGRGPVEGHSLQKAWQIPSGVNGQIVILGCDGIENGVVRLVQFDKTGTFIRNNYTHEQMLGHYAVNFRARDVRALWPKLLKLGAAETSPPAYLKISEELAAWEGHAIDLDGSMLAIFEIEGDIMGTQADEVSEVQTMAIHVSDTRRSQAFYEGLGFELFYDKVIDNMADLFGYPEGTKLHNVNLVNPKYSPNGRVEICEFIGFPGKPSREKAVPPNLGVLSISFETSEIESVCQRMQELGGERISGPVVTTMPYFGDIMLTTFFGLDGEVLEFYQRLNTTIEE